MDTRKAAIFLKTLIKRTEEGAIKWVGTARDGVFAAYFPHGTIKLVREEGTDDQTGDDYSIVVIELLNKNAQVVDTITPYEVKALLPHPWEATESLFAKARDMALGISEAIEELIQDLGGAVSLEDDDSAEEIPF